MQERRNTVCEVRVGGDPHVEPSRGLQLLKLADLGGLTAAMRDASFDDEIGVIVVTGAGTRAFSTGGDVKEYATDYLTRPEVEVVNPLLAAA